jgi:hypothetical protein
MFRIAVSAFPDRLAATLRVIRAHADLSVTEARARVGDGRPVFEFQFDNGVDEVRRCRAVLRALQGAGAGVRVFGVDRGGAETEETLSFLRNAMRLSLQISRDLRDQDDREAAEDQA